MTARMVLGLAARLEAGAGGSAGGLIEKVVWGVCWWTGGRVANQCEIVVGKLGHDCLGENGILEGRRMSNVIDDIVSRRRVDSDQRRYYGLERPVAAGQIVDQRFEMKLRIVRHVQRLAT